MQGSCPLKMRVENRRHGAHEESRIVGHLQIRATDRCDAGRDKTLEPARRSEHAVWRAAIAFAYPLNVRAEVAHDALNDLAAHPVVVAQHVASHCSEPSRGE